MIATKTSHHHRPEHEAYHTPRWAVDALALGLARAGVDISHQPIWDPAAGGDLGYTVGGVLREAQPGGELLLSDIREGIPGVVPLDFEAARAHPVDGLVIATNPPYSRLDVWRHMARCLVGPTGRVVFLVPGLGLSSWGESPAGDPRWEGLSLIIQLAGGPGRSGRVKFELTREEAIARVAVNQHWFKGQGPAELQDEAAAYLTMPAGGWVLEMDVPPRALAVKRVLDSSTGFGLGAPATDHCWAVWTGYGAPPVECRRVTVSILDVAPAAT